jgi:hypothetical protein
MIEVVLFTECAQLRGKLGATVNSGIHGRKKIKNGE